MDVTMQRVAGWVKQWVESLYLRKHGDQTLDGDLTVTGNAAVTGNISAANATATPTADAIIKADGDGKIGAGWIDDADIDHGSIGGLNDDDHTQYARLMGRSGGQSFNGGTGSAEQLSFLATGGTGGGGSGLAFDFLTGTNPGDYNPFSIYHDGTATFRGNVSIAGVVDGDSYIRSNFGGFRSLQLPAVNNGQTLTITITTNSANNNWQHLTRITVVMGSTANATVRCLYHVIVGWSVGTIGTTATVRATSAAINDTNSVTVTGATATTNGFTMTFAATANFAAARSYLLVEDNHINNITIGTAVA